MLRKSNLGQLIEIPWAFSFNEVIYNDQGLPVDYKVLEISPALEKNLGLEKSKVVGKALSEWLFKSEKARENWYNVFRELVLEGGRKEFDEIMEFNSRQYLLVAFIPYSGYLILLFQELKKLKLTEIALRKKQMDLETSRALSQSYFDNAPNAIVIYQVKGCGASGNDYIIKSANPSCLRIEGWLEEDIIGRSVQELRPGIDEFGIIPIFRRVWETGRTAYYPAKVYREGGVYRWFENTVSRLPTGEIVAMYNDVTEKKEAEEELFAEKEKLKVTLHSIGDGVIATDTQGRVELLNPMAEQLTGWKQNEAQGRHLNTIFNIYNQATGKICRNPVEQVLENGRIVGLANNTVLRTKDGKERIIADSAAPIKNKRREILGVVMVFRDVTEAKEKEARIRFLSYRDSLTGLYNRAYFEKQLKSLDVESCFPITLIMGDLDGLKLINDVFGHQVGDQALIKVAEIIRASCREIDIISRWGGDEFIILLPKTPESVGQKICDRIKRACFDALVGSTNLSISLGCASKTIKKEKWEDVLRRAEDGMYQSKLLGERSYRNIILASIKNTLFQKSCETKEHGERLGYFCREIGKTMSLPSSRLDELEVFAMLHDIGKIAIDDSILLKPGALTEDEWQIMKKHPETGYRIAQTVPELINISDYILAHHERWDGKGYPRGLAGEEIPLLSRILAVVDAYDAMAQDRPYRKALSPAKAKDELRKNAGTQFDPQIVEIFLIYLEKK